MDKLTAAKVFIDVTQTLSFTQTAERLDMSRPMVTRNIEAIENWLQVRLLHRTTRKISLTTAGEQCLKTIEQWIEQAENLETLVDSGAELSGKIRVATSMSFGFAQIIPALSAFMKMNPKVEIDVDCQDSVADLIKQRIDLAIRITSDPDPALIGKPIAVCDSVLVGSPEYLQGNPEINNPSDLTKHDCLGYENFERHIWHLSQDGKFESININCRLTANEVTVLLHAAIQHNGISLQPCYLANRYINKGQLDIVLPDWKPLDLKVYALYSSRKHLSPVVRSLIDHLDQYFSEHPW